MATLSQLFHTVLRMSQAGAAAILLALLLRLCLVRMPKKYRFILWAAVLVRLVCPVFPEFAFSPMPRQTAFQPQAAAVQVMPVPVTEAEAAPASAPVSVGSPAPAEPASVPDLPDAPVLPAPPDSSAVRAALELDWAALVWLGGCAAMLLYLFASWFKLKRSLSTAWKTGEDTWELDGLPGPFVLGFFQPRIYLPAGLDGRARELVLLHEHAHLARRDHLVKPLAFLVLALHWFNPLVWLAFRLMSRDMEFACDERVLAQLGEGAKADYSACLLSFASPAPRFAGSPLAFGESNAKSRIKNVLSYKKPAFWLVLAAVLILIAAAAVVLTDPAEEEPSQTPVVAVLGEPLDAAEDLTHYRSVFTWYTDVELSVLAANGPTLLVANTEAIPESSPHFSEEGYCDLTRELYLYDTVTHDIELFATLSGYEDVLAVSAVLTEQHVVLSVLRWSGRSPEGDYLYEVRWYDRDGGAYTVQQTGPCSRVYVPELAALSDGSVVICAREPDGTGLDISVTDGAGNVRYTHEFPKGDYSFPIVLTASGNHYLLREQEPDGSTSFYRGASDGELTRYTPESEGRISTGVYLLGDAIVYFEHIYTEPYFSSPNQTLLHAISPDGAELAQADVSELSPAVLASGPAAMLARTNAGSPLANQELMLISLENGQFVFRPLDTELPTYGFTVTADPGGAYYLDYQLHLSMLDSRPDAWGVQLVRVLPGETPEEYSAFRFRVQETVGDDLTLSTSPVRQAAEAVLDYRQRSGAPDGERILGYRLIDITLMAGGLDEFAIEVRYAYLSDRDGPLSPLDEPVADGWWQGTVQLRAQRVAGEERLYEITAVDQPQLADGLTPVYRTIYETADWYPGRELSLDQLPLRPVDIPVGYDEILLLAELPQTDIALYYLPGLINSCVVLRYGEQLQIFEQVSLTPRFVLPQLDWRDWDGDGQNELAVIYYVGSGTGVSISQLHVYEWDGTQWTDHCFDTDALIDYVDGQCSIAIADDRHHATITLGTAAVQVEAGEDQHYDGFEFPGWVVGYLPQEDGTFCYSTSGGTITEEWPYGFYQDTFSAEGIISYDGTGFHIDSVEFLQTP